MATTKLKTKDIANVKRDLVTKQKGQCPLCKGCLYNIQPINIVLDHCHRTGMVRAALCRGCNGAEGKIKRLANGYGKTKDTKVFLQALVDYYNEHENNPSGLIHPTHKDDDAKRLARNAKARKARAKKKAREAEILKRLTGV
jgi:hypothetical protein